VKTDIPITDHRLPITDYLFMAPAAVIFQLLLQAHCSRRRAFRFKPPVPDLVLFRHPKLAFPFSMFLTRFPLQSLAQNDVTKTSKR